MSCHYCGSPVDWSAGICESCGSDLRACPTRAAGGVLADDFDDVCADFDSAYLRYAAERREWARIDAEPVGRALARKAGLLVSLGLCVAFPPLLAIGVLLSYLL